MLASHGGFEVIEWGLNLISAQWITALLAEGN